MSIMITLVKIETNLEMYIWKLEDAYCKRTHSKKIIYSVKNNFKRMID